VGDGDLLQPAQVLAREPRRTGIVDRDGQRPECVSLPPVQKRAGEQQGHAHGDRDREPAIADQDALPRRDASA
jgi:hypothetical protein